MTLKSLVDNLTRKQMCHHLLNQVAWNVQHMDMTIGSPNNDEHDIAKV
uniref:Uncharacterized protein n=1 Tax=Arundo donax TaxID=35708 RepID=A0A0A9FXX3_ARUDO